MFWSSMQGLLAGSARTVPADGARDQGPVGATVRCRAAGPGNRVRPHPVGLDDPLSEGITLRILLIGIDGSGKSTAAVDLARALNARGDSAVVFKTPAGRRSMARWWSAVRWTPGPRVLDLLETPVRVTNALVNEARLRRFDGVAVIDRGLHCQLALRTARGLPRGRFVPWLLGVLPRPDVVAYFDVPVEVALGRVIARGTDVEDPEHLAALGAAYRELPDFTSFAVVDASQPQAAVLDDLLELVDAHHIKPSKRVLAA